MIIKKQIRERKTFTLDPANIAWLEAKALQLSKPGEKISDSELMNRLITQARLADQAAPQSPTVEKKTRADRLNLVAAI